MIWLLASMIVFSGGRRPRIASAVTDLPEPDSPTSAIVAFLGMSKEMPFTASNVVCLSRRKETRRSRMRTSGSRAISAESMSVSCAALELRIERGAPRGGEEGECGNERGHRDRRRHQLPPLAEHQLVPAL